MKKTNFRRLLLTFETLADLGPQLTAERDFAETASSMLTALMEAVDAREGALFIFRDKPAMLASVAARGFGVFPDQAFIPLLPKHVHALASLRAPLTLSAKSCDAYLSSNGNIAPELFRCVAPLRVGSRLVGLAGMGRRDADAQYTEEELEALQLLANYIALAVHNHTLSESLANRVSEHLRLLASVHNFYDNALETFANAIDIKHINIRGHSLRVGRYSAGIADAMGMDPADVAGLRAAGYLHDIGKVAVDKRLFGKPGALDADEFRQMADHTVVGHQIVNGVDFPWPKIPEVVRWHHERADRTGYPDHIALDDVSLPARIVGVADTFDAMTSERPYRQPLTVGEALSEIVRIAPLKYDPAAVQGLLVQVRRDAVGSNKIRFLDERTICNIAPADVDALASSLSHRAASGRIYSS